MEPPAEELANMQNLGQVLDWCGINGHENDPFSVRGSLLETLGARDTSSSALLGALDAEFFNDVTSRWTIGGNSPSPIQWGQLNTVGKICRLIARSNYSKSPEIAPIGYKSSSVERGSTGTEEDHSQPSVGHAANITTNRSNQTGSRPRGRFSQRVGHLAGLPSADDLFPENMGQTEDLPHRDTSEKPGQMERIVRAQRPSEALAPRLLAPPRRAEIAETEGTELGPSADPLPEVWEWFEVVFRFVFVKSAPQKSAKGLGGMVQGQKFQVKTERFRDNDLDVWVELTPFEVWRSCKCKSLKSRGFVMVDATRLGKGELVRGPLPPDSCPGPDLAEEAGLSWRLFYGIPPPSAAFEEDSYICRWKPHNSCKPGSAHDRLSGRKTNLQRKEKARSANSAGNAPSSSAYPRLCIGTLLRGAPVECVRSWILYHHRIGFERLIMFFDDPDDPAIAVAEEFLLLPSADPCTPHVVLHRLTKEWWEDAKLRSRFYASQTERWAKGVVQGHEQSREVTAKQQLCLDLAAQDASKDDYDWILHIDIDELFYLPDPAYRKQAQYWFASSYPGTEMMRFQNHECVPEAWELDDWFQEVTLFKVNPEFLKPWAPSKRAFSPQARESTDDDEKENDKNAAKEHSSNRNTSDAAVATSAEKQNEARPDTRVCNWVYAKLIDQIRQVRLAKSKHLNLCLPDAQLFEQLKHDSGWHEALALGRIRAPRKMTDETFTYFLAYSDGKAAARLKPRAPLPSFVTHFRGSDGTRLLRRQRADGDADPVILHYTNCGFSNWKRKYEMLGDFPDAVNGELVTMRAHLACREIFQRNDQEVLEEFYKLYIMGNEFGELPAMVSRGLAIRVYGAQEIVDEARIAYEAMRRE